MFGLEKFEYYLREEKYWWKLTIRQLKQIHKKNLAETPSRIQRFILRCLMFDINQIQARKDDSSCWCILEFASERGKQHFS